jgi:hypothetical protein
MTDDKPENKTSELTKEQHRAICNAVSKPVEPPKVTLCMCC